jgi:NADH-quinone oxidoreductase subunit E
VSADGKWSVERAECLGSCDTAPMLQLNNNEYYENLTVEGTLELLDAFERGEKPTPTSQVPGFTGRRGDAPAAAGQKDKG